MESYCCKRSNSSKQGLVRRKYSSSGRVNWVFQLSVFQSNVIRPSGYLPYLHRRVSSNYSCHQKSRGGRVGRNKSKQSARMEGKEFQTLTSGYGKRVSQNSIPKNILVTNFVTGIEIG